jgi:hypothetical protein
MFDLVDTMGALPLRLGAPLNYSAKVRPLFGHPKRILSFLSTRGYTYQGMRARHRIRKNTSLIFALIGYA